MLSRTWNYWLALLCLSLLFENSKGAAIIYGSVMWATKHVLFFIEILCVLMFSIWLDSGRSFPSARIPFLLKISLAGLKFNLYPWHSPEFILFCFSLPENKIMILSPYFAVDLSVGNWFFFPLFGAWEFQNRQTLCSLFLISRSPCTWSLMDILVYGYWIFLGRLVVLVRCFKSLSPFVIVIYLSENFIGS